MEKPAYSAAVAGLLRPEHLPPLGPGVPNRAVYDPLRALTAEKLLAPHPVADQDMARSCLAGLWLYHNFLDESHQISQDIDTPTGSFWHAIMHRREPDPGNAKYWFRRIGSHPVLKQLAEQAPSLGYNFETPMNFVDFCERVRGSGDPGEKLAMQIQQLEWDLLFEHCYREAQCPGPSELPGK